ncbi:MAG: hypothetical protein K1X79_04250 [Oligoflexia bacterium]|nr:hypothetical protein [Oligoflexia bacterium]
MKLFPRVLTVAATALIYSALPVQAEDKSWSVGASVSFFSDYMFRGFNLYDGAAIQPSLLFSYDTGYGTLSYSPWSHISAEGDRQVDKFFEIDHTIAYEASWDPITIKVGHVWYTYPDNSDELPASEEFFATVVWDDSSVSPFSLAPTFSAYHDYDLVDGQYYELGLSHAFDVSSSNGQSYPVTPFAAFGFASNSEAIYEHNGLVQITTGVSSSLKLGDIDVTPSLNYTFGLDDNTVNEFWFGMSLSYSL